MGKLSRNKGHSYEREIAQRFRELYPDARRQLEYHEDDCNGIDIQGVGPFDIQCKRFKKYAPLSCIEEVLPKPDRIPVLITKGDRKDDIVCLYLNDFIEILKEWQE